ncbi:Nyctalopin [Holothuria leucospilota]|uniref:Nyctalopin n=1 Tax=Holothuria leucospilota TaxID=206669 RepID=A0A9Q1BSU9_HOLLE|nr:Nyctalopin [Holothuria leucospilota]
MDQYLRHYFWVASAFLYLTVSSLAQTNCFVSLNDCPRSCRCFYDPDGDDVVTQCIESEFTSIEGNIPSETTVLDISNSAITTLRRIDLSCLYRLRQISLTFNRDFTVMEEGAFGNSSNLKKIEMYGNNLQNLDESTMRGFAADDVTELHIHSNPNLQLRNGFMALFRTLEVLNVADTPFQYKKDLFLNVSSRNYENLDNLRDLNMESKQIRILQASVLQHTPNIRVIRLGHNDITEIDALMFTKNPLLEEIYVDWNQVTSIHVSAFSNQQNLRYLDLTGNNLVTVPMGTFDVMPRVSGVCLSWNPLSCDCNMQWLSEWMTQVGRTNCMPYSFTQCSGEFQQMGQVFTEVSDEAFCDEESSRNISTIVISVFVAILVIILICFVVFFIIIGLCNSGVRHSSGVRHKAGLPPISTIPLRRTNSYSSSALL